MFDDVITNIGNAYDVDSSTFICPISGIYMFSLSLMSAAGHFSQAYIMHQGSVIVRAFADDDASAYASSSNVAFVQCTQGQSVWVMTSSANGHEMYPAQYTTFTGALYAI